MKPRTLLVLLLLVAGLGSFIWFYERKLPSSDERTEQAKHVLPGLETDAVSAISIERDGREVRLEKVAKPASEKGEKETPALGAGTERATWRILRPLQARADASAVSGLLASLTGLEKKRTLDDVDPAKVGLAEPRASVKLETAGGVHEVRIGSELPASNEMVVGVAGDPRAFVVSDGLWNDIEKSPGDWRSKDLFTGERAAIDRVTLAEGDHKVLLARRGQEFWLESPVTDRADRTRVDELLSSLTGLRAESFVDEPGKPPAELGLEPPVGTIEVVLSGKEEPFRLALGSNATAAETGSGTSAMRYAKVGEQVVEINGGLADDLARPVAEWRSRDWSPFEVYEIEKAKVEPAKGEPVTLSREGGNWQRDGKEIPYSPVSDFLYAVSNAKATRLLDAAEAAALGVDREHPEWTLELAAEGDRKATLELLAPAQEGVPAVSGERDVLLLLPKDAVEEVESKLSAVRKAEPVAPEKPTGKSTETSSPSPAGESGTS